MAVNINKWADQSFKNWLLVGAPLLIILAMLAAACAHAAWRTTWIDVLIPALLFALIQIVWFGVMYFARKYARSRNDFRPAALAAGSYCLSMGLLALHYSARWGFLAPSELKNNYELFTILVVAATLVVIFFPFHRIS
jgi:hypothetical protein